MTARYATIISQLTSKISGVTNIDNIFTEEQIESKTTTFKDRFESIISGRDIVQGWWFDLPKIKGEIDAFRQLERIYEIKLCGFISFDPANGTSATMIALVENIMDAIDTNNAITGVDGIYSGSVDPVQLDALEPRVYGPANIHAAELVITIRFAIAV